MDTQDWNLYWLGAVLLATISGWCAKTGVEARERRILRAWAKYAFDVALLASVVTLVLFLVTDGKGCTRPDRCFCDNDDVTCIDRYCR